jgi:hypothetical protein
VGNPCGPRALGRSQGGASGRSAPAKMRCASRADWEAAGVPIPSSSRQFNNSHAASCSRSDISPTPSATPLRGEMAPIPSGEVVAMASTRRLPRPVRNKSCRASSSAECSTPAAALPAGEIAGQLLSSSVSFCVRDFCLLADEPRQALLVGGAGFGGDSAAIAFSAGPLGNLVLGVDALSPCVCAAGGEGCAAPWLARHCEMHRAQRDQSAGASIQADMVAVLGDDPGRGPGRRGWRRKLEFGCRATAVVRPCQLGSTVRQRLNSTTHPWTDPCTLPRSAPLSGRRLVLALGAAHCGGSVLFHRMLCVPLIGADEIRTPVNPSEPQRAPAVCWAMITLLGLLFPRPCSVQSIPTTRYRPTTP